MPVETFTRPETKTALPMDQLKVQLEALDTQNVMDEYKKVLEQNTNPHRDTRRKLEDLKTQVLQQQLEAAQQSGNQGQALDAQTLMQEGTEIQKLHEDQDIQEYVDRFQNPQFDVYRQVIAQKLASEISQENLKPSESIQKIAERLSDEELGFDIELLVMTTRGVLEAEIEETIDQSFDEIKAVDANELKTQAQSIDTRTSLEPRLPQDTVWASFLGQNLFQEESELYELMANTNPPIQTAEEFAEKSHALYLSYVQSKGLDADAFAHSPERYLKLLKDHNIVASLQRFSEFRYGPHNPEVDLTRPTQERMRELQRSRHFLLEQSVFLQQRINVAKEANNQEEVNRYTAMREQIDLKIDQVNRHIRDINRIHDHVQFQVAKAASFRATLEPEIRGDYGAMNGVVDFIEQGPKKASQFMDYVSNTMSYYGGTPLSPSQMSASSLVKYAFIGSVSLGFLTGATQTVLAVGKSALVEEQFYKPWRMLNPKRWLRFSRETIKGLGTGVKYSTTPALALIGYMGFRKYKDDIDQALTSTAELAYRGGREVIDEKILSELSQEDQQKVSDILDIVTDGLSTVYHDTPRVAYEMYLYISDGTKNVSSAVEQAVEVTLAKFGVRIERLRQHQQANDRFHDFLVGQMQTDFGSGAPDNYQLKVSAYDQFLIRLNDRNKTLRNTDQEDKVHEVSYQELNEWGVLFDEHYNQIKDKGGDQKIDLNPELLQQLQQEANWYRARFLPSE